MSVATSNPRLAELAEPSGASSPPAHSRLAVASFALSLLGMVLPTHLIVLLAIGTRLSRGYVLTFIGLAGACCVVGITAAAVALFDRRKNRVLGLAGWWLSIVAFSLVAVSIRFAIRHHVLGR